METAYTFTVAENNQIIFTKDEEPQFTTLEELEMIIAESFPESYVGPEKYAKRLKHLCLAEYENKYKEVLKS